MVVRCRECGRFLIYLSDPDDPKIKKRCLLTDDEGRITWDGNPYFQRGKDVHHIDPRFWRDPCTNTLIL